MSKPENFRRNRLIRFINQEAVNVTETADVLRSSGIDPDRYVEGSMRVLNRLQAEFGITSEELRTIK